MYKKACQWFGQVHNARFLPTRTYTQRKLNKNKSLSSRVCPMAARAGNQEASEYSIHSFNSGLEPYLISSMGKLPTRSLGWSTRAKWRARKHTASLLQLRDSSIPCHITGLSSSVLSSLIGRGTPRKQDKSPIWRCHRETESGTFCKKSVWSTAGKWRFPCNTFTPRVSFAWGRIAPMLFTDNSC